MSYYNELLQKKNRKSYFFSFLPCAFHYASEANDGLQNSQDKKKNVIKSERTLKNNRPIRTVS